MQPPYLHLEVRATQRVLQWRVSHKNRKGEGGFLHVFLVFCDGGDTYRHRAACFGGLVLLQKAGYGLIGGRDKKELENYSF